MSCHKITAGSGYDYLTRHVARLDGTHEARPQLASYYSEKGEVPGVWVGTGLQHLDGLSAGDPVTADQMQALFGSGHHPLARERQAAEFTRAGSTPRTVQEAARLGTPFHVYPDDISPFRIEVARRLQKLNETNGRRRDAALPADVRARVRTAVAREMFLDTFGRPPQDARELAGHVARLSRQQTTAVAGFDLTFSPVKSVSTLWALADPHTAAAVERAHNAAVADALRFVEQHALYSRAGARGVRQVDVHGLIATAFTHRDSRAGDPDLHTHVAVANKVLTRDDPRWLSIDGRVLLKAIVAASETYNTALERHLVEALGVRFAPRPTPDGKRPVREVVGVDPALNERWSTRRAHIETRRAELAADFQHTHGRPPSPVEAIALAQQANLETRDAKHEPRSLPEQRATWRAEARHVLGSEEAIGRMLTTALHPTAPVAATRVDEGWLDRTAASVLATVEGSRSTWQGWHVRAEALRRVRDTDLPANLVDHITGQLVERVLTRHSIPLARPADTLVEPAALRRADGTSQYVVAGADLYTSSRILDAEQALVAAAGRRDRYTVTSAHVAVALAESAANGVTLNAGQAALVEAMATSGVRLQVAIAPAGSGKTTAMRALTQAWTDGGGTVIGLAPSAAAAAQLREHLGSDTDTLAKLVHSLDTGTGPDWVHHFGAGTLVVVDEAGMADTLTLHRVVSHVLAAGGSVRLVGDDQQLAAIGAGGVLRDIEATHGALRLDELVRFADPAEGAASLALRHGHPEALGFYLDRHRVHVGDLATMTDDTFTDWTLDRSQGLDAIMLAPTRELVAELNQRARTHRLASQTPGREVTLADGNQASTGDTIITRTNNRRLRTTTTDFVKNGDRWTVLDTRADGSLHVQHTRTRRTVTLPADYVTESVELGYASTIYTAQGVTVDVARGVLAGGESRQLLYTMLTRGRHANHAYLAVVGDGNEHTVLVPETLNPLTPTDTLERLLARDQTPTSATTLIRTSHDPATLLNAACSRYADAVAVAAEQTADPDLVRHLTRRITAALPEVTDADAWPTLRSHLLMLAADGHDPLAALSAAWRRGPLTGALDPAAVLDARLDLHQLRSPGPLPWLPGIPTTLADHTAWGGYLTARRDLVATLTEQVRHHALTAESPPVWVTHGTVTPDAATLGDVEVWRAATGVEPGDLRPTGDRQPHHAEARHQIHLDRRLDDQHSPALDEWGPLLREAAPTLDADAYLPQLARRLAHLSSQGLDARSLLTTAVGDGILPDDHPAGALWWRITRTLDHAHTQPATPGGWLPRLLDHIGNDADTYQASPWWPTLVGVVDRGLQRGWSLETLLALRTPLGDCQQLVEHVGRLTRPAPAPSDAAPPDPRDEPPADLWANHTPDPSLWVHTPADGPLSEAPTASREARTVEVPAGLDTDDLTLEALVRNTLGAPPTTPADVERLLQRVDAWRDCPVAQERLELVNQLTRRFYQHHFPHSWARGYLADRFGVDLTGHPEVQPGYAPHGWTTLTDHLRTQGITDTEMLTAGVATQARTGRLIDRFRDRAILPVLHDGVVLGFVGRRNPHHDDQQAGPKYLNTAETPLFHKGAQLYGATHLLEADPTRIPVLVEGPFDAHAVTLVSHGRYIGVAPLGTSLTTEQATQLRGLGRTPIIATDNDLAGRLAAERDYWLLTPHGLDPLYAKLPDGADPADLLAHQPDVLTSALRDARPLAETLTEERLTNLAPTQAALEAVAVLAAQPAHQWEAGLQHLARQLDLPDTILRATLKGHVRAWNHDPARASDHQLAKLNEVKARLAPTTEEHVDTTPRTPHTPSHTLAGRPRRSPDR